jgi:peptidoglycan biosynthesis protein MviN/MurJ (putative lipid II flippase)
MFWFFCLLALAALVIAVLHCWKGKVPLCWAVILLALIHLIPCLHRLGGSGAGP